MEADDLYGLPLDRFVPERTMLARALRADGRRDEAVAVAARTKPSVAAWAVNQLVRTQKRDLTALLRAGDALRQAQDGVLTGHGDGRALRAAAEAERSAVDALVATARGLLTSDGHQLSAPMLERVAETLHAAALDDDARAQVSQGCLERELRHVGFGVAAPAAKPQGPTGTAGAKPPRAGKRRSEPKREREREQAERERAKRERAERERAERERAAARKAARAAAAAARRRADRADRALQVAQDRRDQAAQALAEADEALTAARAEAQAATAADAGAQDDLKAQ